MWLYYIYFLNLTKAKTKDFIFFLLSVLEGFIPRALSSAMLARTAQLRTLTWLGCQMHCSIAPAAMTLNTIVARLKSCPLGSPYPALPKVYCYLQHFCKALTWPSFEVGFTEAVSSEHEVYVGDHRLVGVGEGKRIGCFKMILNQNDPPEMCQEELKTTS